MNTGCWNYIVKLVKNEFRDFMKDKVSIAYLMMKVKPVLLDWSNFKIYMRPLPDPASLSFDLAGKAVLTFFNQSHQEMTCINSYCQDKICFTKEIYPGISGNIREYQEIKGNIRKYKETSGSIRNYQRIFGNIWQYQVFRQQSEEYKNTKDCHGMLDKPLPTR